RQVPAIPSSSSCPRQNRVPSQTGATPPSQSSPSAAGATQRPVSLEHTRPSLQRSSSVHSPPAPSLSLHLPGQLSSNTQMRSPSHSISAVQSPPSSTVPAAACSQLGGSAPSSSSQSLSARASRHARIWFPS